MLEVYEGDKIHFMAPLARQNDFYVPETLDLREEVEDASSDEEEEEPPELSHIESKKKEYTNLKSIGLLLY